MIATGKVVRSYNADVIVRLLMRILAATSTMLISKGLLTRWVEQPGEGTVETDPDFHVVVLTLRLDIYKFLFY